MIGPANPELVLNKMCRALNPNCSVVFRTMKTTYNFALLERLGSSLQFCSRGNTAAITEKLVFKGQISNYPLNVL